MNHPTAHTNGDYLAGRPEVYQAAGMLAVQLQLRISAAHTRLEAHAAATGRPLLDVRLPRGLPSGGMWRAVIDPPGELMYIAISARGSSAASSICAQSRLAMSSSTC
jgi:hypothetical protein